MSAPTGPDFYSTVDQAPQQGDILLAQVARVVADDDFAPTRWQVLDEGRFELLPTLPLPGAAVLPALRVVGGRALVMVTTHDCGLDKEFNAVVDQLVDPDKDAMTEQDAMRVRRAATGCCLTWTPRDVNAAFTVDIKLIALRYV